MRYAIACRQNDQHGTLYLELGAVPAVVQSQLVSAATNWLLERGVSLVRTIDISGQNGGTLRATGFCRAHEVLLLESSTRSCANRIETVALEPVPVTVTEGLIELVHLTYIDSAETAQTDARSDLSEHLRNSDRCSLWWKIRSEGNVVGVLLTGIASSARAPLLYLGVFKEHRSKQIGRSAIALALQCLRAKGVERVTTHVDSQNDSAIRCYTAACFHEIARSGLYVLTNHGNGSVE